MNPIVQKIVTSILLCSCAGTLTQCASSDAPSNPKHLVTDSDSSNSKGNDTVKSAIYDNTSIVYDESIGTPEFNIESGFYDSEIELKLSSKKGTIHYTTDGSIPDMNSPEFKNSIKITDRSNEDNVLSAIKEVASPQNQYVPNSKVKKCTIVRAAIFNGSGVSGPVATNTYFVGMDQQNDFNGLPVISLVSDYDGLFGYENGIYVLGKTCDDSKSQNGRIFVNDWEYPGNYANRGREWERQTHIELFEADGNPDFERELGMRIMGNASRTYNQKSFRMYARKDYGEKNIKYPLIPGNTGDGTNEEISKYKTFLLRNGGNDCSYAKIRDPLVQTLVKGTNVATQESRPVVAFLNGEYWGIYALEEDYSANYIETNYGVDSKDVIMIKCGEIEEGTDEDMAAYNELKSLITADLSNEENYQKLCDVMDIQSYIDYCCIVSYTGNKDSMFNNNNNWRLWRSRTVGEGAYQDGKWRFMLFDTEYSMNLYNQSRASDNNSFKELKHHKWFSSLMNNDSFKAQFFSTLIYMRDNLFCPEKFNAVISDLSSQYGPLMSEQYKRFGPSHNNGSQHFEQEVNEIKNYLEERYNIFPTMLKQSFELDDGEIQQYQNMADEIAG